MLIIGVYSFQISGSRHGETRFRSSPSDGLTVQVVPAFLLAKVGCSQTDRTDSINPIHDKMLLHGKLLAKSRPNADLIDNNLMATKKLTAERPS